MESLKSEATTENKTVKKTEVTFDKKTVKKTEITSEIAKTAKKTGESESDVIESIIYPEDGNVIIFNIFDTFRNGTMYYEEFTRWVRFSYIYT